ncbi:CHAT domain-containing protein [Moheibacter lacus]|uniref:CHAT domain-containing protein n=1 Tax=Moheibacter lacus TaxID=2745851 RepID=A0A838ZTZ5_9FLAO|nr:CHAT domain-containing tetratricopeptide repeat protein [Moheibacter lacus]MBA5630399.1 CHAT domain-containing protein [Moheibacter lacus]
MKYLSLLIACFFLISGSQSSSIAIQEIVSVSTESEKEILKEMKRDYKDLMDSGEREKAIEKGLIALEFSKKFTSFYFQNEAIEILLDLGSMYSHLKLYKEALSIYNDALEIEKKISRSHSDQKLKIYYLIAYVNNEVDNFNEKMKALEKAEQIIDQNEITDKQWVYNVFMLFVHSYIYYGDMEMAKKYLKKSNFVFESNQEDANFMKLEEEKHLVLKSNYANYLLTNLRVPIIEGNHQEVTKYFNLFEKEIDKQKTDYDEEDLWSINNLYIQMALYHTRYLQDYEKAVPYFEDVLEINQRNNFQWGILDVSYFFAYHYIQSQNLEKAIYYLKECLKNPEYENYTYAVTIHQNLGSSYFYNCEFENAVKHFDQMMNSYKTEKETYQGVYAMRDLYEVGNIYIEIYEDLKDKKILQKAYEAFRMSSELFSSVYQGNIYNDYLSVHHRFITDGLLYCSFILKDKQKEAMELIEMNNSDFLWTNFIKKQSEGFLNFPIELKENLIQLENETQKLELQLQTKNEDDKSDLNELKNELKIKKDSITKLSAQLETEFRSFHNFTKSSISLDAIQSDLEKDEIIIKHIVTDFGLYTLKLTKTEAEIRKTLVSENYLSQQVGLYLQNLKERSPQYKQLSKVLYKILVEPLNLKENQKIIFINDSFLSYLPFETLMDEKDFFLLEKKQISYSNSLKLWNIQRQKGKVNTSNFIAFSPEYSENSFEKDSLLNAQEINVELRGAKKEANQISKLWDGQLYDGQKASKTNFLKFAKDVDIVHLAMHAVVDETDNNQSNLIFQGNERLYFHEFYEIDLPAQLVVLSACNTGLGNVKAGEGVISISRAFTFSGVKSTLMSLWQIPDKETPEIMLSFYENLKAGQTKDAALQEAKLNYLKNTEVEELKHPYYWAGFIVTGDTSSLNAQPDWIWWIIIGLVISAILFFVFKKKNSNSI